jgi:uncharacterized membrane protein
MSTTPSPNEPNDSDKEVLDRLFGAPVHPVPTTDQVSTKVVWYIGLALVATVVFWILSSLEGPIILKAVTFFIIILGLDLLFINWRRSHSIYR